MVILNYYEHRNYTQILFQLHYISSVIISHNYYLSLMESSYNETFSHVRAEAIADTKIMFDFKAMNVFCVICFSSIRLRLMQTVLEMKKRNL